jgi:hypothetical protein
MSPNFPIQSHLARFEDTIDEAIVVSVQYCVHRQPTRPLKQHALQVSKRGGKLEVLQGPSHVLERGRGDSTGGLGADSGDGAILRLLNGTCRKMHA